MMNRNWILIAISVLGASIGADANYWRLTCAYDEFSIDDLIVVELQDGVSVFKRLKESEFDLWLEDYSIGELWDKNVLGGGLP